MIWITPSAEDANNAALELRLGKADETGRRCRMNLAVHDHEADIRNGVGRSRASSDQGRASNHY